MTDQRWWAPDAPGIGPDEFDLELLAPGGEADKDLGQAFLALHRVGAAACEAVATQPLADESVLAFALANMRRLVVPEASEIVSKSVGDNPNYGNLLLRDILDDAEATSLSLWRSCIAKSVPPPMAAQRVGMVYGIPPGHLFHFQKLATDPRALPAALQDAADRALFTFADQLVKDEAVDRKVEIAKQRPRRAQAAAAVTPDDPDTAYYDARDASGQFAAQEAPVVPPELPTGRPERIRAPRTLRTVRTRRTRRTAPQKMAAPGRQMASQGMAGHQLAGRELLAAQLAGRSILDEIAPPKPVSTNVRTEREPGDVMAGYPGESTEGSQPIPYKLAYTMSTDEFQAFVNAARKRSQGGRGRPRFKAGRLEEYAGGRPEVFADWDAWADEQELAAEHQRTVAHVVQTIRDAQGSQPAKITKVIQRGDIEYHDNPTAAIDALKMQFLTNEVGLTQNQAAVEMKHVEIGVNFHNPQEEAFLVYSPPPASRTKVNERPSVEVTEAIVLDDNAIGFDEAPHGGPPDWRLVKDQTMTFTVLGDDTGPAARRFWDNELQAFRNYRYIRADDEVDKALSPERFHQLEEQGYIVRDDEGRFAETEEEAPLVAVPTRRIRRRTQRTKRTARTAPQMAGRQMAAGQMAGQKVAGQQMSAAQMQALKVALQEKREEDQDELDDAGVLWLPDDATYLIPPIPTKNDDMALPTPELYRNKDLFPTYKMRHFLHSSGHHSGLGAEAALIDMHQARHVGWRPIDNEVHVNDYENIRPEDLEQVAYEIHERMQRDPNFTVAVIHMKVLDNGNIDLKVNRNRYSLGVRSVVRVPHDVNLDLPIKMRATWTGQMTSPRMIRHTLLAQYDSVLNLARDLSGEGLDAPVEDTWWITNPHVQVWEVSNRDKR